MSPWHCHHEGVPGSYDERARRASHEELAVGKLLAAEGHHVRTVAESRGARSPDLAACGVGVEVKSFQSLEQRGGRPPTAASVANKLLDASGQGSMVVIWGAGSGLTSATAQAGYRMFCQEALVKGLGRARDVRLAGDGFDIPVSPVADLRKARAGLGQPGFGLRPAPPRPRQRPMSA